MHEGRLRIDGSAPDQLRFLHADGTAYGSPQPDHRADLERALHQLGFDKAASRRAAAASIGDTLEEVIRSALRYAHMDVGLGARGVAPIT